MLLPSPDDYILFPVADLPYMHQPGSDCSHNRLHEVLCNQRGALGLSSGRPGHEDNDVVAGRELARRLANKQLKACGKHKDVDWRRVIDEAIVVRDIARPWSEDAIKAALDYRSDDTATVEQKLILSLFLDPIRWDGTSKRVNAGQHRLCGARLAGIGRVLVGHTRGEVAKAQGYRRIGISGHRR